jgi:hypothetical protein
VVGKLSEELVTTAPTTLAGVAAVLAYWSEIMEENEWGRDFHSTLVSWTSSVKLWRAGDDTICVGAGDKKKPPLGTEALARPHGTWGVRGWGRADRQPVGRSLVPNAIEK